MSSPAETLDRNAKGNVAEAAITFHAAQLGIHVFRPLLEHGRCDLVMEIGPRLLRVQCKWGQLIGDVIRVRLASSRMTAAGYVRSRYQASEIDAVSVYCGELARCYLLPAAIVTDKDAIHLRLEAPKNGQRAGLHWASQYELSEAVALEVASANSAVAIPRFPTAPVLDVSEAPVVIGAHEFRNHFGYYMELAQNGAEIEVTRHGRPSVKLVPARATLLS